MLIIPRTISLHFCPDIFFISIQNCGFFFDIKSSIKLENHNICHHLVCTVGEYVAKLFHLEYSAMFQECALKWFLTFGKEFTGSETK